MKIIVGDVHGCLKTLKALVAQFPQDAQVVFVGDLIDRGSDSCGVIDFVKKNNYMCVLGNHESMMGNSLGCEYLDGEKTAFGFAGAEHTLRSYKGDERKKEEHLAWIATLKPFIVFDDVIDSKGRKLVVSHSFCLPWINEYLKLEESFGLINNPLDFEKELFEKKRLELQENIMWNRWLPEIRDEKFFNVYGHTPTHRIITYMTDAYPIVDTRVGVANIDTGACYHGEGKSVLTAMEFPSLKIYQQKNIED